MTSEAGQKLKDVFDDHLRELYRDAHIGRVLTICALLEDVLKTSLTSKMVLLSSDISGRIFGGNGPLSTISSRIDLAYALGLLSKEMRRDLHLVRKIRNDFAHTSEKINFESERVVNLCKLLKPDMEATDAEKTFTEATIAPMKHLLELTQNNAPNISSLGTSQGIGLLGLYHQETSPDQTQKDEEAPPQSSPE